MLISIIIFKILIPFRKVLSTKIFFQNKNNNDDQDIKNGQKK